jgi:signal transduction histidine kinase
MPFMEPEERFRWSPLAYASAWLPYLTAYVLVFSSFGMSTGIALRAAVANVLPEAVLGLAVPALVARVGDPAGRAWGFLSAHALIATAFSALATAGKAALFALERMATGGQVGMDVSILAWQAFVALLVYVALSGVAYAGAGASRLRAAHARAARAEALRARAELAALRAQLNPHFLMNALHSVLGLVRRDPDRAESAIEGLGDLLRYALRVHRDGLDEMALEEEWAFVGSYLELERVRLGDRLRVDLDAGDGTLACRVPTFVLQVLVENAVRHAIAPRAEGGRVSIRARREGAELRLTVEDDGSPASVPAAATSSGGLRLLRERLHALHGDRAALEAGPVPGGGFRAAVRLPCAARHEDEGPR